MLDDRKLAVLRAIVTDYVQNSEPVGAKALVERHRLDVSSATIRNDMAALEEDGLIVAPSTASPRSSRCPPPRSARSPRSWAARSISTTWSPAPYDCSRR